MVGVLRPVVFIPIKYPPSFPLFVVCISDLYSHPPQYILSRAVVDAAVCQSVLNFLLRLLVHLNLQRATKTRFAYVAVYARSDIT